MYALAGEEKVLYTNLTCACVTMLTAVKHVKNHCKCPKISDWQRYFIASIILIHIELKLSVGISFLSLEYSWFHGDWLGHPGQLRK